MPSNLKGIFSRLDLIRCVFSRSAAEKSADLNPLNRISGLQDLNPNSAAKLK